MTELLEAPHGSRWRRKGRSQDTGRVVARFIESPAGQPRRRMVILRPLSTAGEGSAFTGRRPLEVAEEDLVSEWERLDPPPVVVEPEEIDE